MKRKRGRAEFEETQLLRFAWWASFFATIALLAIVGFARSAQAMTVPPHPTAALVVTADEEEEAEDEYSECEFAEEEEEEEEECEAEAEEEAEAPRECVLSSAGATVTAATNSDKIRLVIRYTAYTPGSIQVAYWLRGAKGPLSLGSAQNHLGTQGVIRDTETLSPAQMTKALAAKSFTIQLRPAHAPRHCDHLLDRHLTVRHNASGRLTWSDPGSVLTSARP